MCCRISRIIQATALLVAMVLAEPASADCFGSAAWTVGAHGLCVTTDRAAWDRVALDREVVSLDPGDTGVPVLVDGTVPISNVTVAVVPESPLSRIGDDDYAGDGNFGPTPANQRLSAGVITELFQVIPEIAPGSLYVPLFPSVLDITSDASNGVLSLWVEPGVSNSLDFDTPARRPRAWGATFSNVAVGAVAMHAVLGSSDPADAESNTAAAVVAGIDINSGFLGMVTPVGTNLARVRFVVASGSGNHFQIDSMVSGSSVVPEPSMALLVGLGLIGLTFVRASAGRRTLVLRLLRDRRICEQFGQSRLAHGLSEVRHH